MVVGPYVGGVAPRTPPAHSDLLRRRRYGSLRQAVYQELERGRAPPNGNTGGGRPDRHRWVARAGESFSETARSAGRAAKLDRSSGPDRRTQAWREDVTAVARVFSEVADQPVDVAALPGGVAAGRPLRVSLSRPGVGPAYWRWDCRRCGEYGGGAYHADALGRALRHCAEHPEHRSALLPPVRCRQRSAPLHPVLADPTLLVCDDGEHSLPVYPLPPVFPAPGVQRQGRPVSGRP